MTHTRRIVFAIGALGLVLLASLLYYQRCYLFPRKPFFVAYQPDYNTGNESFHRVPGLVGKTLETVEAELGPSASNLSFTMEEAQHPPRSVLRNYYPPDHFQNKC